VRIVASCAAVVAAFGTTAAARAQEPRDQVGVVRTTKGRWVRDRKPIGAGHRVFRGDTIRSDSRHTSRPYVVVLLEDGKRVRFACDSSCTKPFVPVDSVSQRSISTRAFTTLVTGVANVFSEHERRYSFGLSRGNHPGFGCGVRTDQAEFCVSEAVLRLDALGLDLAPAFGGVSKGSYDVRFRPLAPESTGKEGDSAGAGPIRFAWDPDRPPSPAHVSELEPGLYGLVVSRAAGRETSGSGAWVLIVQGAAEHRRIGTAFEKLRLLTRGWKGAGDIEVRAFLRAALDYLACEHTSEDAGTERRRTP
jgi:hypothetical protein